MTKHKMVQKLYPGVHPWKEYFFDGEVQVVDNTAVVDKDHWRDEMIASRGFVEVPFEEEPSTPKKEPKEKETKPASRRSGGRKKSTPNTSAIF